MAGAGGIGAFPARTYVRHSAHSSDEGSRVSASARIAAAVVAVGGIAGAAQVTVGSGGLPSPAAWFDTGTRAAAAEATVAVPAQRTAAEPAVAPIADSATIAALATPAVSGGSAAGRAIAVAPGVHTGAADAAHGASDSVVKVQKLAAQQAAAPAPAAEPSAPVKKAGKKASAGGAVSVVSGRVSSGFGSRWGAKHGGMDIAAPIGTPIHVPMAGTVISSGPASGFGMWVRVRHADGTVTVYGHINRSLVKVGQKVSAGQQIAEVGNRGQSTGPHLHIEVHTPGGQKINPKPWLDARGFSYT